MTHTLFNTNNSGTIGNDDQEQQMFLGQSQGVRRWDISRYPQIARLFESMDGMFWRPEEIATLGTDRLDYDNMTDVEKRIFEETISFQTALDSVAAAGVEVLGRICTNSDLEGVISLWNYYELNIHARSYSTILRNVVDEPARVFDKIIQNDELMSRAATLTKHLDKMNEMINHYELDESSVDMTEMKKQLIRSVASIYVLECIRFYSSFAVTFSFGEQGRMPGTNSIVKLIARDENLHAATSIMLFRIWKTGKDDPEMAGLIEELEEDIKQIFVECVEEELNWCNHIFSFGSLIGLNAEILQSYIKFLAVKRARALNIDLSDVYSDAPKKDPIPWINTHLGLGDIQNANQEKENIQYLSGALEMEEIKFNDFVDLLDLSK